MAQTGYTPIYLYYSGTATHIPLAANLGNGELAINAADGNLFYKNTSNAVVTVPLLQSSSTQNGWLSSTDWTTFNSKQPAGSYLTSVTADSPLTGAGTSASHLSIPAANGSTNGYLSSTDWTTFNSKQPAGTYVTSVSGTAPVVSSGGTTPAISMAAATGSVNGYLTSTDWTTFNNKAPAFTYTSNYIPYGQGTTTPTQSANLTFNGTTLTLSGARGTYTVNFYNSNAGTVSGRMGTIAGNIFNIDATGDSNILTLSSNGTEAIRVDASANAQVTTGNLVIGTSGKGIDFSATAGTGTSELLADYEEGTWDAVISDGTNNATMSNTTCRYTKVGRLVTLTGRITTTSIGSVTGAIRITGLPYTIGAFSSSMFGYGSNFTLVAGQSVGCYGSSSTYVNLSVWTAITGITAMTATQWGNTGDIVLNFTYTV